MQREMNGAAHNNKRSERKKLHGNINKLYLSCDVSVAFGDGLSGWCVSLIAAVWTNRYIQNFSLKKTYYFGAFRGY